MTSTPSAAEPKLRLPAEDDELIVSPASLLALVETGAVGWGADASLARSLADDVASGLRRMHAEHVAAWPESPDVPGAPDPEPLPLPLRDHAHSVAESMQVPEDLPILLSLGCLSAAAAGRVEVSVRPGWCEPVGLYVACIFPPAGRKSPTYAAMTEPLRSWETEAMRRAAPRVLAAHDVVDVAEAALVAVKADAVKGRAEPAEVEAARLELEDARAKVPLDGQLLVGDITPEALVVRMDAQRGRVAILEPEPGPLQLLAGRYSNAARLDELKKAWSAEAFTVDRVGRPPLRVSRPALTMALMLQPGVLEGLQHGRAFRHEGVFGRFLWCRPPHRLGSRLTGADVPPLNQSAAARYARTLCALLDMETANPGDDADVPHVLRFAPGAIKVLHAWEAEVERDLADGERHAPIRDWAGKVVGQSIRVAALLELAARAGDDRVLPGDTIGADALEAAVRLMRALATHALEVLVGDLGGDSRLAFLPYVLRRARAMPPGSSLQDLYQRCRGNVRVKSVEDIEACVHELAERGCMRVLQVVRSGPGRPRSPRLEIHPSLTRSIPEIP